MRYLLENVSANVTGEWIDFGLSAQFRHAFANGANTLFVHADAWDGASVAIEIRRKHDSKAYPISSLTALTEDAAAHLGFLGAQIRAVVTSAGGSTAGLTVGIESYS